LEKENRIKAYCANTDVRNIVSLSDIEEKEFQGIPLEEDEAKAIQLFRDYRLAKLSKKVGSDEKFNERFEYFQALSNLVDYRDWLNKKF